MHEAKKIERLRTTLALPFAMLDRSTAEFDQAGFLGLELQTEERDWKCLFFCFLITALSAFALRST